MTWGFMAPGHFYALGLSRFPRELAPCLLGSRMLTGRRLVKNGLIGLDHPFQVTGPRGPASLVGGLGNGQDLPGRLGYDRRVRVRSARFRFPSCGGALGGACGVPELGHCS
jgi:hypothetical protein